MSKHFKHILLPLILVILALAGVFGLRYLISREANSVFEHKKTVREIVSAQGGVIFTTRPIAGSPETSASLFQYFPAADQEVDILERLEKLAAQVPVSLSIVSAQPNDRGIVIDLEGRGSFSSLYHYLRLLEKMDLYLVFEGVNLRQTAADNQGPDSWTLETTITIPAVKK